MLNASDGRKKLRADDRRWHDSPCSLFCGRLFPVGSQCLLRCWRRPYDDKINNALANLSG
ncbi:hypothetical protein BL250_06800 [Erwinia sp. OLTSP20]|nr:hypothetical protein BV501_06530 [Erwinia sp. OAMSP11]PIJ73229.1 hypothetical protein BK416_07195 [Erwinia sp. OLSSP12]PIJ82243.1 hypothetical protein BLD47_06335 [Erwinia sp. OLCASP19]PIJ85395.1 hypothetical protein BLD46_06095 [Erwinia sp. OLMTSP26]PIJ87092.1 hypothetical protein BLD49_06750 [Erwinia sp. OLMDSP33]PIJ89999.1 hypothetical protein BL249_14020 [Erwinia sp. OLFS4]PIJ93215.1 hypothetical protein BL250_06800 [Erwinia sp. OLTSP20]